MRIPSIGKKPECRGLECVDPRRTAARGYTECSNIVGGRRMMKAARTWLVNGALGLALSACSTSSPEWAIEQAEQYRAQGRPRSALRQTARAIQRSYDDPDPRVVQLHIAVLRDLGRTSEADAFREFTQRYVAGANTYTAETEPSWKECRSRQYGDGLIRSWGRWGYLPKQGNFEIGTVAATFEVDFDGKIHDIKVLRAKHPGSAWLIIDTVGSSRISPTRLRDFYRDTPDDFPVSQCAWWNYADIEDRIPDIGRIRGFR